MAQAGGKDPAALDAALDAAREVLGAALDSTSATDAALDSTSATDATPNATPNTARSHLDRNS
jgi:hypothetical protein